MNVQKKIYKINKEYIVLQGLFYLFYISFLQFVIQVSLETKD